MSSRPPCGNGDTAGCPRWIARKGGGSCSVTCSTTTRSAGSDAPAARSTARDCHAGTGGRDCISLRAGTLLPAWRTGAVVATSRDRVAPSRAAGSYTKVDGMYSWAVTLAQTLVGCVAPRRTPLRSKVFAPLDVVLLLASYLSL